MEQRFKVGDVVTYISKKESAAMKLRDDRCIEYRYGGECRSGRTGEIINYRTYNESAKCWSIEVSLITDGYEHEYEFSSSYAMLECEFHEYAQNTANGSVITSYEIW
jgi:hypothetical protein